MAWLTATDKRNIGIVVTFLGGAILFGKSIGIDWFSNFFENVSVYGNITGSAVIGVLLLWVMYMLYNKEL